MKYGGGGLVDAIGLAQRVVFVNGGVERVALDKRANLGHFRGGEHGGHRAVHVAVLFPLFLILEQGLLHGLTLAELRGGASVARGYPRVRVHGEREIPMDQVDLAAAHVIFHQPAIRGGEQGLAGWTLKIAEDLHGHGSVLRAKGLVRIHVGNIRRVLRGGQGRQRRESHQYALKNCSSQNAPMFHTILRNSLSDLPLRV